MTPEELAAQFLALTDSRDWPAREALFAEDCELVTPGGVLTGRAAGTAFSEPFVGAFSDAGHQVTLVLSGGDAAVVEGVFSGTHTSPLVTPAVDVPPTGRTVELPFAAVVRTEGDQIRSLRISFDQMAFLGQPGLLPEPAST
ncbi:MAG: ester cyclase [Acidimicrobiales bacterium]